MSVRISGTSLTPAVAEQVGLDESLRGILVIGVTAGGPAEQAGLQGSTQQRARNGQTSIVSAGDVITAIDGLSIDSFDDLSSYLFNNTTAGQTVQLTILRGGAEQTVEVTLEAGS